MTVALSDSMLEYKVPLDCLENAGLPDVAHRHEGHVRHANGRTEHSGPSGPTLLSAAPFRMVPWQRHSACVLVRQLASLLQYDDSDMLAPAEISGGIGFKIRNIRVMPSKIG